MEEKSGRNIEAGSILNQDEMFGENLSGELIKWNEISMKHRNGERVCLKE